MVNEHTQNTETENRNRDFPDTSGDMIPISYDAYNPDSEKIKSGRAIRRAGSIESEYDAIGFRKAK